MIKNILIVSICTLWFVGCASKNSKYVGINESQKDGLLSSDSKVVIKPIYDEIGIFKGDHKKYEHPHLANLHWLHNIEDYEYAIVKYNNKYGIINKKSELLLMTVYDEIGPFFNGFAKITENGKVGLINEKFEIVLKPKYEEVEQFYNEVAYVKTQSGLFGCIDKKMNLIIKPQFDRIYLEVNNYARVVKEKKWGFIDNKCNVIAKPTYDYVYDFSNNLAKIKYNGKIGYLDTKGKLLTKLFFDEGDSF